MNNIKTSITLAALLICGVAQAQKADSTLLIAGSNYRFTIPLPKGWVADTTHAKEYLADVVLYRESVGLGKDKPVIRIAGYKKDPQNPSMEFQSDSYRKDQRLQEIQKHAATFNNYTYIRMIIDGLQYITYINPGPSYDYIFSVIMENEKSVEGVTDKLAVEAFLTVL